MIGLLLELAEAALAVYGIYRLTNDVYEWLERDYPPAPVSRIRSEVREYPPAELRDFKDSR